MENRELMPASHNDRALTASKFFSRARERLTFDVQAGFADPTVIPRHDQRSEPLSDPWQCVTPASRAASMALCCVDTLFLVSSIGEDTVALHCLWHYQIEQEMQESGMDWTILRPHHFMQNLLTQTEYIINDSVVYSASGDGKIPYIDARDIAAVAVVTLTKPGHRGKIYVITGSEALSYRQATEIISNTIGKPLRFIDESPDAARARREREGYPPAIIESVLAIGAYQRAGGKTVSITNVVSDLTGRPPRTFREFAQDHAAAFRG